MKTIKTILKISSVILAVVIISFFSSCFKKEYECSCTDTFTDIQDSTTTVSVVVYTRTSSNKCWELDFEVVAVDGSIEKTECKK